MLFAINGTAPNYGGLSIEGPLTLDGNQISADSALIQANNGTFLTINSGVTLMGNVNSAGNGGGVNIAGGTFTMNGGTISGNEADKGGGVYSINCIFTMQGDAKISINEANEGGGMWLSTTGGGTAILNMQGSALVHGNTASGNGGGMYIAHGGGVISNYFVHENALVYGNEADMGGGVYLWSSSTNPIFRISGGIITGEAVYRGFAKNTASSGGAALRIGNSGTATAQYGAYANGTWSALNDIPVISIGVEKVRDDAIDVKNGVLR